MAEERKKGAKSAARTELVAVRFDPETKYMMEIAAKAQRRSIANYVEWAVEESFKSAVVYEDAETKEKKTVADLRRDLWDPIESDRFCILASWFPNLITHDEQQLWKLIWDVWSIVQPVKDNSGPYKGFRLNLKDLELTRKHWELLKSAAQAEELPSVVAKRIKQIDAKGGNHG